MARSPRPPSQEPARMGKLATLPVFLKLEGRRVVMAGGSEAVAWKAELFAAAGALVEVHAPEPCEALLALAAGCDTIEIKLRALAPEDLAGAAAFIADAANDEEAAAFHAMARAVGLPVNVIDQPAWCDFQFGSIVERSPLVVAISTDGGAPVFGQMLRARIETLVPEGFRKWAQAAKDWRPRVTALNLDFRARRRVWELFARRAFTHPERAPDEADLEALLAEAAQAGAPEARRGSVVLVGAGPGDPELLTLKAVRALQSADVVLYDDLVLPGSVDLARREAQRLNVGKRGYKPSCTQEDITAMLVSLAREGKRVVRLKGGDPMIFGRAGEEIAALKAAGVDVEVIPGVTAASAAAASLQVSLTERAVARRLQFITAHARDGKLPEDLDWRALADEGATTAVYMGLKTLPPLVTRLLAEGLAPDTPAVIVERASWESERRIASTLLDLPATAASSGLVGPCLVLIGRALGGVSSSPHSVSR